MTPSALRRHRALGPLLALLLLPAALTSLPAAAEPARPADPPVASDEEMLAPAPPLLEDRARGRAAVRELGDLIDVAAARNDLRTGELRSLLLEDRTAWLTTEGRVYYAEPVPEVAPRPAAAPTAVAPLADTFALHSKPGARLTIYLDAQGETVEDGAWVSEGLPAGDYPAWDASGNGPAFDDAERLRLQQVWAMVAEDFAAFDVDVTTEDPGDDALYRAWGDDVYGARVLISPSEDARVANCGSCLGVAFLGVFDHYSGRFSDPPAWVFPHTVGDDAKAVADVVSHEAGHVLGLKHDGDQLFEYYAGHGMWGPIMGNGHQPVMQWSAGSYAGADNQEDDLATLAGYLGLRADEADGTPLSPAPLPTGEARIATPGDVDAFVLGSCPVGTVVDVEPTALSPNLDVSASLQRAGGAAVVTAAPASGRGDEVTASGMGASVTVPANAADWVLSIDGVGDGSWASDGYDDYGSIGAYAVSAPGCTGQAPPGVPSLPNGVTATPDRESVTLTWTAPSTSAGGPVTSYVVGLAGSHESVVLDSAARSHAFDGLTPLTDYVVRVRAVNAQGAGPWRTVTTRTLEPAPVLPTAPRGLELSYDLRAGSLYAYWYAPFDPGSHPITGYAVYLDGERLGELGPDSLGTTADVGELAAGRHELEVTAVTVNGESPPGARTFDVAYPAAPDNDAVARASVITGQQGQVAGDNFFATGEPTDPAGPAGSGAGGYSLWYSWTPTVHGPVVFKTVGGGTDRDTVVTVVRGTPGAFTTVATADGGEVQHGKVGFDAVAGTRYLVVVDGEKTPTGRGEFSLAWDQAAARVPSDVIGVQALPGLGSATVSWVPADANGSAITGYTVTSSPEARTCTTTGTTCTVTGLTAGTSYTFTVVATNAVGSSAPSRASDAVRPYGLPIAPPAPTATPGDGSATVFHEQVPLGGSPFLTYEITASPGGRTCTPELGYVFCEVTGLTNGTAYTFTVRASNEHGAGPVSAASAPVTPQSTRPSAEAPDKMAVPKVAVRGRKATVTWRAATDNGSPVSAYVLAVTRRADVTAAGTARKVVLKRLKPGRYDVRIAARNEVGTSPWSGRVRFRVR